jgi:hypothetical protein
VAKKRPLSSLDSLASLFSEKKKRLLSSPDSLASLFPDKEKQKAFEQEAQERLEKAQRCAFDHVCSCDTS